MMRLLLGVLLATATLVALGGFAQLVTAPDTDADLLTLIETWEPDAIGTYFFFLLETMVALFAGLLAWLGSAQTRRLAIATALMALLAGGVKLGRHIMLTRRIARLTAPTGDEFYGLS